MLNRCVDCSMICASEYYCILRHTYAKHTGVKVIEGFLKIRSSITRDLPFHAILNQESFVPKLAFEYLAGKSELSNIYSIRSTTFQINEPLLFPLNKPVLIPLSEGVLFSISEAVLFQINEPLLFQLNEPVLSQIGGSSHGL